MSQTNTKKETLIQGLILVAGLLLLALAVREHSSTSHLMHHGVRTQAKVIEVIEKRDKDRKTKADEKSRNYTPVFEFTDNSGKVLTAKGEETSSSQYSTGQTVEIIYDPSAPAAVRTTNFWGLHGTTVLFGVFGLVCLGTSIWFFMKRSRSKKTKS
jgi:hypothetical protein